MSSSSCFCFYSFSISSLLFFLMTYFGLWVSVALFSVCSMYLAYWSVLDQSSMPPSGSSKSANRVSSSFGFYSGCPFTFIAIWRASFLTWMSWFWVRLYIEAFSTFSSSKAFWRSASFFFCSASALAFDPSMSWLAQYSIFFFCYSVIELLLEFSASSSKKFVFFSSLYDCCPCVRISSAMERFSYESSESALLLLSAWSSFLEIVTEPSVWSSVSTSAAEYAYTSSRASPFLALYLFFILVLDLNRYR